MTLPAPELFDLLGGRSFRGRRGISASAEEHRLSGLLLDAVDRGQADLDRDDLHLLAAMNLGQEQHHRRLWDVLGDLVDGLADAGIDVALLKGVANEARWYEHLGHRPSTDLDLLVAPHHVSRIAEVIARYAPDYPTPAEAIELVQRGLLQHVHFQYRDVTIDVHLDVFKLGVKTVSEIDIWAASELLGRPDGGTVRVLDRPAALVLALLHLNKDRFAFLGSYDEIRRIADDPTLDWNAVHRIVDAEGLAIPAWSTLSVVADTLGLQAGVPAVDGWRRRVWGRIWPPKSHLDGYQGRIRSPYKQKLLPLVMVGRHRDALAEWRRVVLPPRALLDLHKPEERDRSYLRRVTIGRL